MVLSAGEPMFPSRVRLFSAAPLFLFQGGAGQLLADESAESMGRERHSARAAGGKVAGDHAGTSVMRSVDGCCDGGDGGREDTRSSGDCERHNNKEKDAWMVESVVGPGTPRRRRGLETAGFSRPAAAAAAAGGSTIAAGASTAAGRGDEPASAVDCLGESEEQGGASFQSSTDRGPLQTQLPLEGKAAPLASSGSAEQAPSPCSVAPAWCCGDNSSLEDLVCWTKALDYDAAVKGL